MTRLGWAKLENANLAGAKLHKADLKQADLRGAKLIGADLAEADLTGAQLQGAILLGVDGLTKEQLQSAIINDGTLLPGYETLPPKDLWKSPNDMTPREDRDARNCVSCLHVGLIGRGEVPLPGEVSLAHCGVLFLAKVQEFKRHVLEVLR